MQAGIEKKLLQGAVMLGGKFRILIALGTLTIALSACAGPEDIQRTYALRWGPDPAMPSDSVGSVAYDQAMVLKYIMDYAPNLPPGPPQTLAEKKIYWAAVAHWGFNVGRQDCEIYMNVLFKINRERLRNGGVITAFRNATTAVVGVAGSSPSTTMSILSASFGLLSAVNDAYFATYLFSAVPAIVAKKVSEQQATYQASFTKDDGRPFDIQSPADAYHAIRGYYQICLPETIEGTFLQQVASGKADSKPPETKNDPVTKRVKTVGVLKSTKAPISNREPTRINTVR
jgi:hypothetical protein